MQNAERGTMNEQRPARAMGSGLRLGSIVIDPPWGQAALSGYSDWPMRVVAKRLGAPYTLCEVLLDQFVLSVTKGKKARRYIQVTDEEHPCGAQLMGHEPQQFTAAARRMVEAGFDVIDLNFACPVRKVLGKCRGGYLLSDPATALEIVDRVREALPPHVPLTVKMRRGMDDSPASRDRFFEIFDGAFARGVAAVAVHGRSVRQKYEGQSSWQFLTEVKRHAGTRMVLGSGDLFTAEDCLRRTAESGVDGVLVARGAIGNPWIFRQLRELAAGRETTMPTLPEQAEVIGLHYRLAEELYGPSRCTGLMCKFGIKYARLHPEPLKVRDAFIAARKAEDWWNVLRTWYGDAGSA